MTFLPVAARELLVASHSPWLRRLRILSAIAAAGLSGFFLIAHVASGSRFGGSELFNVLNGVAFLGALFSGVALTADSISSERRAGTLGFLFLTDLSGFDIVTGKLASAWIRASTILISLVPFLAVGMYMGGVSGADMLRSSLSLLNLLWGMLVLGISISSRCTKAGTAALGTLLGVGGLVLVAMLPSASIWIRALHRINPAEAWIHARVPTASSVPDPFWTCLIASHLAIWALLLGASLTLPRSLDSSGRIPWFRFRTRHLPRPLGVETGNPVELLCRPSRGITLLARVVAYSGVGLTLSLVAFALQQNDRDVVLNVTLPVLAIAAFVLKILYAWHCCDSFTDLKEFGVESILGTGISERSIPEGVFRAGRRVFFLPAAALIASALAVSLPDLLLKFPQLNSLPIPLLCVYGILVGLLDFQSIGWWSARSVLKKQGSMSPFVRTVIIVLAARFILFCVPNLLVTAILFIWGRDGFLIWLRARPNDPFEHLASSR